MHRYMGIDSGKFGCKCTEADVQKNCIKREFQIRTRIGEGDFRDDALELNTVIAEYDGVVYKVGNGASVDAALDTTKLTDVHKICALVGMATVASANEVDEFHVATGIPISDWSNVSRRCDAKEFFFPEGEISIKIKTSSKSEPVTKKFKIVEKAVYPEGIGGILADGVFEDVSANPNIPTGVIDAGQLNVNCSFWQGLEPVLNRCITTEAGGVRLINDVAAELSAKVSNCDSYIVSKILTEAPERRHLPAGLGLSDEEVAMSKEVISNTIKKYVGQQMYSVARSRDWSLNAMRIVAIGGTSEICESEMAEQFGNITLLPDAQYCNSRGYLRLLCAHSESYGEKIIALTKEPEKKTKEKTEKPEKAA